MSITFIYQSRLMQKRFVINLSFNQSFYTDVNLPHKHQYSTSVVAPNIQRFSFVRKNLQ
jgi:hypothetical protein